MIIGVIDIPLNFILSDSPNVLIGLRAFGTELGVIIILLIQYFPKIYTAFTTSSAVDTMTLESSKSTNTTTMYIFCDFIYILIGKLNKQMDQCQNQ